MWKLAVLVSAAQASTILVTKARADFSHVRLAANSRQASGAIFSAARDADALVIVTEWDEFRALDLGAIAQLMRGKLLIDLRNVYEKDEAERAGLTYVGVGRGRPNSQ